MFKKNQYRCHIEKPSKINTIKVLNSESIVIIQTKGEHLLFSKISGGMIGYHTFTSPQYAMPFTPPPSRTRFSKGYL
jgi:hypothetical protein